MNKIIRLIVGVFGDFKFKIESDKHFGTHLTFKFASGTAIFIMRLQFLDILHFR